MRILQRHHAARDVGGVGGAQRVVAGEPAAGAAVAGLAADAVGDLESRAARAARRFGVAAQAVRRVLRRSEAQALRRCLARVCVEHLPGPAVGAGRRWVSCQVISSFWRTTMPLGARRPWQVEPAQVATPSWVPGASAA